MPRRPSHPQRSARRTLALAGSLALSLVVLAGCLEEDVVTPTLRDASARLESLGAPGSAVPGDEFRMGEYRAVIAALRPVASEGNEAQNAAAALMIARAEQGLAELPAIELAQVNRKLYDLAAELRGELNVWNSLNSLAETAASFSPETELGELNAKIQERDAAIQAAQEASAKVQARVTELESLAQQAADAGAELRQDETELRTRATAMNPIEAQPLHEQAAKVRREADAFEMKAEQLLAQADTIRPEITDATLEVEKLTQQRDLLVASTKDVAAKGVEGREEAKQLRAQAADVAKRIEGVAGRMESLRTGEATEKLEAVKTAYGSALSSAGRARQGDRTAASLASAEIQQQLGNALGTHAQSLAFAADVLEGAANARAALPGAGTVQSTASGFRTLAVSTRAAAVESLVAARDAYSGAGLRAEESERIERVSSEISAMIVSLGGPAPEAPVEESFEEAPAEDSFEEAPTDETEEAPAEDAGDPESGEG